MFVICAVMPLFQNPSFGPFTSNSIALFSGS